VPMMYIWKVSMAWIGGDVPVSVRSAVGHRPKQIGAHGDDASSCVWGECALTLVLVQVPWRS